MPIYVTVYHLGKTTIGTTEGDVTRADIEAFLDDIVKARAAPYRKIFDATRSTADRPMRVFTDIHSPQRWLDEKLPIS